MIPRITSAARRLRETLDWFPSGTILLVVRGMILAHSFPMAITSAPLAFNQDIRGLICADFALPSFAIAALESQKHRLLHLPTPSTHGTMRVVTEELFASLIPTPSLAEQQAIAAVLDAIDGRLERGQRELTDLLALKLGAAEELLTGQVQSFTR